MYRDVAYLDTEDFVIKLRRFEQDYIDFNMREKFSDISKFYEQEFIEFTRRKTNDDVFVTGIYRPYVLFTISKNKILQKFIENIGSFNRIVKFDKSIVCYNFSYNQAIEIQRSTQYTFNCVLKSLQHRGLKSNISKLNLNSDKIIKPDIVLKAVNNYLNNLKNK